MGFGTLPALLGFGWFAGLLTAAMRRVMFKAAALAIAMMGGVGLWRVLGRMGYLPPFPLW